jgi:hypothetical protein
LQSFFFANIYLHYSVLNATTGSFFEALLEGIIPEIRVRRTLIAIRMSAAENGRYALRFCIPVSE